MCQLTLAACHIIIISFQWWEHLKSILLVSLKYIKVLTIITIFFFRSPGLNSSYSWKLYPSTSVSPLPLPLKSNIKYCHSFVSDSFQPRDCSLPGSSVHGIFQAVGLEWIVISFSKGSSQPRDRTRVSCIVDGFFTVWNTHYPSAPGNYHSHLFLWVQLF